MDLADIRLDVRERIGEDAADFFTDAEVDRAINLAQTTFIAEEPWPWLYTEWATTLSEGVDTLDLPVNVSFHRVFNLSLAAGNLWKGRMIERLEPAAGFRTRFQFEAQNSAPIYYYLTAATVDVTGAGQGTTQYVARFIPTPDTDYDVEAQYLRVPAIMDDAAEGPDLPDEFHPAIPAWASAHLFLKEVSIPQKAQEQFQLYFGVLAQARKLLEVQQDSTVAWSRETPLRRHRPAVADRIAGTLGP